MSKLTRITPEAFEIANAYLESNGSAEEVAQQYSLPLHEVVSILQTPEIKRYLDGIYLDLGYRNRSKIGQVMDMMIEAKLEEAEESGIYSSKDLLEILQVAHKMRMDEIKAQQGRVPSTAVQINETNNYGDSAYGKLMEKLMGPTNGN